MGTERRLHLVGAGEPMAPQPFAASTDVGKKNVEGQGERVKKKDPKIPPCDGLAVAGFTREEPPNKKHEQKTKSRHLKRGNDPEFVSGGHCWVADRVTSDSARKVLRFERHRETTPFFSFSASTRRRAEFYRMFLR